MAERIGGSNFVHGPKPGGFNAQFVKIGHGEVEGIVIFDETKEGPPGHAHGGAIATLLDEAMGAAGWSSGHRMLAVNLNVNLKRSVPLNVEIRLVGRMGHKEGRKVFASAELYLPDGTIAAESTGIFIEAPPLIGAEGENPFLPLNQEA